MHTVDKINLLGRAISLYTHIIRKNWIMRSKAQVTEIAINFTNKVFGVHPSIFEKTSVQVRPVVGEIYSTRLNSPNDDIQRWDGTLRKVDYLEVLISFPSGDELSYLFPVTSQGLVNPKLD